MRAPRVSRHLRHIFASGAACAGLACLALVPLARAQVASAPLEARVDGGVVRGALEHNVVSFKGIPYAAPPVGASRWAPPQPVQPWTGIRAAVRFGSDCTQVPAPGDPVHLRTVPGEDCLYLNVWRPRAGSSLPVMVWIPGGGFVNSGTSVAANDGSAFARDGVVIVTLNYRLGNLGFFAFPALDGPAAGGLRGNYALMDQIAALKWVQRRIAAFGGDPHNVTIFGESAGGMSIHALLMSPLARGLFAKAIIESGAGRGNVLPLRPLSGSPDSAEAIGISLARHLGIEGDGPHALAALRALPAAMLVGNLNMATMNADHTYVGGPIVDGSLDLGAPASVYASGGGARVPVMIGTNTAEIGSLTADSLPELWQTFGPDAAAARRAYDPTGERTLEQVSAAAGSDQWMVEPARAIARLLSARGQPVYEYRFGYIPTALRKQWTGAPHASEVAFVFETVGVYYGRKPSPDDDAMARAMHAYWIAFARTGRPDSPGEPDWPQYRENTDRLMSFTNHGPMPEADPWKQRLDLAERVAQRQGHGPAP